MDLSWIRPVGNWVIEATSNPTNVAWIQALAAGGVGAWVGSWATQRTINKHEELVRSKSELRAINQAINLCYSITNHYLGYKKQMVLPTGKLYKSGLEAVTSKPAAGITEINVEIDHMIHPQVNLPTLHLQDLIVGKISIGGRGLISSIQLRGASESLNESIAERRRLIEEMRGHELKGRRLYEVYFAIADRHGNIDSRFSDNVHALQSLTDDCIFFSTLCAKDLHGYGAKLIQRWRGKLGTVEESLDSWNWGASADELMPRDQDYEPWLKGFEPKTARLGFWKSVWSRLRAKPSAKVK